MGEGFYWPTEEITKPVKGKAGRVKNCTGCKLYKGCRSPKMPETGKGGKRIFILAEAPGKDEDERGKQLVGKAGKLVRLTLKKFGVNLEKDCIKMNAVNCRPPANRTPDNHEIDCCRQRVLNAIKKYKPHLIIVFGGTAVESLIGHRWKKDLGGINKWRGWCIPDRDFKAWICPVFHPNYVQRMEKGNPAARTIFEQDIRKALSHVNKKLPKYRDEALCVTVLDDNDAPHVLRDLILDKPAYAFHDYETTGIKLYIEGHRVMYMSIATSINNAIAFRVTDVTLPYIKRYLVNPYIQKAAHNLQFEERCGRTIFNVETANWVWCSMNAAHVQDNRKGKITGLKFQVYVNFGVIDYASSVDGYLQAKNNTYGSNSFNRLEELDPETALKYCGLDSLFGFRLSKLQMKLLKQKGLDTVYNELMHPGILALADIENTGMAIDSKYVEKQIAHTDRRAEYLKKKIMQAPEIQYWKRKFGSKFKLTSPDQLRHVLFTHLKLESVKLTTTGKASTDEESMDALAYRVPFVKDLVTYNKLLNAKNTFLTGIKKETVNGTMHPFFHMNTVVSYRSSSSNVNFQNQPIRNKMMASIIRRAFIPRPGRQIMEVDYSGLEVAIAACVTGDPALINYVTDKSTDMHRDMAMELCFLKQDQVTKDTRYCAKNSFVFATFYGSYWAQTAKALWDYMVTMALKTVEGQPLREHLAGNGIRSLRTFEKHVEAVEDDFWYNRFNGYREWRDDHIARYNKQGYFDTVTGFRCSGFMKRNELFNLPIQGPAFHCLLWSLARLNAIRKEERWRSVYIGQIHDALLGDVVPLEVRHIVETTERVMCKELPTHWDWITVPLEVETEITPVDGTWYDKKELVLSKVPKLITKTEIF